uniref:Uncharacterized protein n=1 Tax=Romanomermis culicivorax TaxID=13658 RepID=A0A915IM16_ROMCU
MLNCMRLACSARMYFNCGSGQGACTLIGNHCLPPYQGAAINIVTNDSLTQKPKLCFKWAT